MCNISVDVRVVFFSSGCAVDDFHIFLEHSILSEDSSLNTPGIIEIFAEREF